MQFRQSSVLLSILVILRGYHFAETHHNHERHFDIKVQLDTQYPFKDFEDVFKSCMNKGDERKSLEKQLIAKGKLIKGKQTDVSLGRKWWSDPQVYRSELAHIPFDAATAVFAKNYNLTRDYVFKEMSKLKCDGTYSKVVKQSCDRIRETTPCQSNSKYRTISGRCNNLQNPQWGSAMACFQRFMSPFYIGANEMRESVLGGPLPPPRRLSLNVHSHRNVPTNYVNHMYMFYGQLLAHDITFTPISIMENNDSIECCPISDDNHPQCAPIAIGRSDPFYGQFGVTCLNFVRSALCPSCALGAREQMNQQTSFIDGSFIYGTTENEIALLRTNDGTGRLRVQSSPYGDLLPRSNDPNNDQCSLPERNQVCFQAGDSRANQHTTLTALQTLFMREHNRLADELRNLNPHWDGDTLFQEARRIVGAEMQAITYKEYLPITLGSDRMSYFRLWISNKGSTSYDPSINPQLYNEFSAAGFRFAHSLINMYRSRDPDTGERTLLRNDFFQPFELYSRSMDPILSGPSYYPAQWFDRHLVPDVTNFLYRVLDNRTGLDLASFDIQRGRDHGMPPYIEVVKVCSEDEIIVRSFDDLVRYKLMTYENADILSRNYRYIDDIDLWTGINCEIPNTGAVVGPTAACLIGLQFRNLKFGDRFYFEHRGQEGSFTYQQMQELRGASLSKIICANTQISQMPLNAMLFSSRNNPLIECRRVRGINLSYWKD